jgi:hypothetical protein
MPELTWTTTLTWFGVLTGAIGVSALLQAWLLGRSARQFHADVHAATQATLADMRKGFTESHDRLGQMLARMDDCWREAFERMDRRADERHRDVIEAIAALKR